VSGRRLFAALALSALTPSAQSQALPQAVEITVELDIQPVQPAPLPAGRGIRLSIAPVRTPEPPALALGASTPAKITLETPPGAPVAPAPALSLGASGSVKVSIGTAPAAAVPPPPALVLGNSSTVVMTLAQAEAGDPARASPSVPVALAGTPAPAGELTVQIVQVIPRGGANFFDRSDPTGQHTVPVPISAPAAPTSVCGAGATVGPLVFVSGAGVVTEFDPGGIPRIGFTPVGANQVGRAFNGVSLAPLTIAAGTSQALSISSAPVGITRFRVGRDGANVCVRVTCHSPILTGCPV